jgi:ubiquinone biosynthesis monooxygenase Coq7
MRINHAGEIAAQALYSGQAFTAQNAATSALLQEAAAEETDHLAWCETRLQELGGRTSYLDPLWYLGSFAIGSLAGIAGDKTSLAFVAETEQQVSDHLSSHLRQLPIDDARSRAVLEQMLVDEAKHGQNALHAGAGELPSIVRTLMKATAKVMTRTAAWL